MRLGHFVLNNSNMPKLRVLVVDDHDVVRHIVCALLSQDPTLDIVCQSATGEDAVSKAAELRPDLIVLDIGLPGISGLEAARQILQMLPRSKIASLAMWRESCWLKKTSKVGGHGYVTKIDAASELHMAIRSITPVRFRR
jgi:DNA-binding NarL/FixJ family response regulator